MNNPPPPTWYTVEELWHHLRRQNYSDEIADELCAHYARNLQLAFNKGYEFAWREAGRARETDCFTTPARFPEDSPSPSTVPSSPPETV